MSDTAAENGLHPLRQEVRLLLQVAMTVFVWTVAIGILNGTDVVDPLSRGNNSRKPRVIASANRDEATAAALR